MPASSRTRVAAPRPPEPPPPFHFPVIATVAPLAGSAVLWAITQSPFTLVFAALGPVIAIASLADSRLSARRTGKRQAARFDRELAAAFADVEERHDAERAARREATPGALAIVSRRGADPYRWRGVDGRPLLVSVGTGEAPSGLEVDVATTAADGLRERLADLSDTAARLSRAPVVIDAALGIGVVGPRPLAIATLRAIAIQLAWSLSPSDWWIAHAGLRDEADWLNALPHRLEPAGGRGTRVEFGVADTGAGAVVAIARSPAELPRGCRVVLEVGGGRSAAIAGHPDREERRTFRIEAIGRIEAMAWAPAIAAEAAREGLVGAVAGLPDSVAFASLLGRSTPGDGLAAAFAVADGGPVVVDLVADGPHAVVGGTTGSGKSELLVAWVLAMAAAHPPDRVSFLLVDFKGGSAFAPLESLPHTVGVITDLDEHGALRALESLRAELRHRERALADARARDIVDVPGMPRLVIVVDEFAAMLADHPDLHALFTDLAARGRSLGIHLVLCTQRPAGVVRDAVLANTDLRISLRVNNRADSSAVIGTDAAAAIPATARGRALVCLAGEAPKPVQAALATEDDARTVAARWRDRPPPRRPWVEPLPVHVGLDDLVTDDLIGTAAAGSVPFGLLDLPHEQRRSVAGWDPATQGNLLVLGAPGSGKSVALATIAAGATAMWLPRAVPAAWDVISDAAAGVDSGRGGRRILVVDDLDALVARVPGEHRTELLERLARVLREGPQQGLVTVLAAQRVAGELQSVAGLAAARLMLRHASRQDWVLAGADGTAFSNSLPQGGGTWLGHRVQVAFGAEPRPVDAVARSVALDVERPLAVVTSRVGAITARLTGAGFTVQSLPALADPAAGFGHDGSAGRVAILGDVDDWQSRWGSIAALRPIAELVFDACSTADLRVLTRTRELPPPIARHEVWRLAASGEFERSTLPG